MTFDFEGAQGYRAELEPARDYDPTADIESVPEGLALLLEVLKARSISAVASGRHVSQRVIQERCGSFFCSLTGMKLAPEWVTEWLLSMEDGLAFVEAAYCDASESAYVQFLASKGDVGPAREVARY